jgi:hypothetical protein
MMCRRCSAYDGKIPTFFPGRFFSTRRAEKKEFSARVRKKVKNEFSARVFHPRLRKLWRWAEMIVYFAVATADRRQHCCLFHCEFDFFSLKDF